MSDITTEEVRRIMGEELDERLKPLARQVHEHHETLYGNGKDGIKTQVDRLWQWKSVVSRCLWLIAGCGLTGVVAVILRSI